MLTSSLLLGEVKVICRSMNNARMDLGTETGSYQMGTPAALAMLAASCMQDLFR